MDRLLPTLGLAAATTAIAVPGAHAATLATDRACYADPAQRADTVTVTGSGFAPGGTAQMLLDGQPLPGSGTADRSGAVSSAFTAPALDRADRQHTYTLTAQQGATSAATTFTVSRLFATFSPAVGDPSRMRVRFKLYGFGLGGAVRPTVFVHYVAPGGRLVRTVRLGRAGGACGFLRTGRRRLFPFVARRGAWRLQFDTAKRYRRGRASSTFLFYTVGVTIRSAGA